MSTSNTALLKKILTKQNEMAQNITSLNEKLDKHSKEMGLSGGRRKKVKDPNAPSRPRSAWIYYYSANSKQFREDHSNLSQKEITTEMSKDWKKMSDKQKAKYNKLAEKDRERYATEKAAYEKKQANDNAGSDSGSESDDEPAPPKKSTPKGKGKQQQRTKQASKKKVVEPEASEGSDDDSISDLSLSVSE